ncbi:MAG: hypothetical protein GWN87_25790, partial [Desulfuromonadales bacterium]|nr:hypothetical protein [Desulfuromonadales bacterium]
IAESDTVFRLLMDSPNSNGMPEEDRRLFAGVITLAAGEPHFLAPALGLDNRQLTTILQRYFPQIYLDNILFLSSHATTLVPEINSDVRNILRSHVP